LITDQILQYDVYIDFIGKIKVKRKKNEKNQAFIDLVLS